jgi:hypothetical protein
MRGRIVSFITLLGGLTDYTHSALLYQTTNN